jgi:hypothetical protein
MVSIYSLNELIDVPAKILLNYYLLLKAQLGKVNKSEFCNVTFFPSLGYPYFFKQHLLNNLVDYDQTSRERSSYNKKFYINTEVFLNSFCLMCEKVTGTKNRIQK